MREILLNADYRLRQKCEPVAKGEDVSELIADMREACKAGKGIGLAAPQLGVLKNVVLITLPGVERVLVNPVIYRHGISRRKGREGCLSFPGRLFMVERWTKIWFKYTNEYGAPSMGKAKEFTARVIQHEMDHLNGIVLPERGTEIQR